MTKDHLAKIYGEYIGCLNRQGWPELEQYVHAEVQYNNRLGRVDGFNQDDGASEGDECAVVFGSLFAA